MNKFMNQNAGELQGSVVGLDKTGCCTVRDVTGRSVVKSDASHCLACSSRVKRAACSSE